MLRKFDYLEDKQQSQAYNFVQEQSQPSLQFDTIMFPSQAHRRRYRVMHATIQTPQLLRSRPSKRSSKTRGRLSYHLLSKETEDDENERLQITTKNNLIYHKVMDKHKEQFYRVRIREGIKQITNHQHLSLIPSLNNKHSSLYSEFQACSLERKLKKRLKLSKTSKSKVKRKEPASIQAKTSVRQIREGLDKRIYQIYKIVNEDAQSINLKIQDPMNQMQRIRIITENKSKDIKMTKDPGNGNIEDNIFEVRQLMRRYLNKH